MLYCTPAVAPSPAGAAAAPAVPAASAPAPAPALTARCQHGAGGGCHHCLPPTEEELRAPRAGPLNKAGRYAPRHLDKSSAAAGDLSGDMEWLCTHRADAMCTNCAPLHKGDPVQLPMLCLHGPSGRCTNW